MFKRFVLVLALMHISVWAFSQTSGFSIAVGPELNNNSSHFVGVGGRINTDYRFGPLISFGSSFLYSYDLSNSQGITKNPDDEPISFLELAFNLRFYFGNLDFFSDFDFQNFAHIYAGASAGLSAIYVGEKNMVEPLYSGEIGSRLLFFERVFLEPYIRFGVPFMYAVGFTIVFAITDN
jgi:hypothetical protein